MHLKNIRIRNFRRLRDVQIELEETTSIFVGANNSGKTSATHVFYNFLERQKFALHDFSMECWKTFDEIGAGSLLPDQLPIIDLDLWFTVEEDDLHKVLDLLPSLDWDNTPLGVRLEYAPRNNAQLLQNFKEAYSEAKKGKKGTYHPWPKSLTDYLSKRQSTEYEVKYYVVDFTKVDSDFSPVGDYRPTELGDGKVRSGSKILKNLIRVDFLSAQRHLSDLSSSGRSEDLSKRLSKFYERNLKQREEDFEALRTLSASENSLTEHLTNVFAPTLTSLNQLGYPGLRNPTMIIKAALNQEAIVSQNARLHYSLADNLSDVELPDSYNGLGFKNLIYMVIELLDFHASWACDENRSPLHLVLIEEPEAHLHTQLQQVFIREILKILDKEEKDPQNFITQLIVTTHSPHIIYESGFKPIRYFNRNTGMAKAHTSTVLNLSAVKFDNDGFLERYMKLTHCDLFFSDAVILVEGNVERLLLPLMIDKVEQQLQSSYLTILEVGGAFAFRFKELIEFLGITTLVITDLDCVSSKANEVSDDDDEEDSDNDEEGGEEDFPEVINRKGKACLFDEENAETSNSSLAQWLPKMKLVSELIEASSAQRTQLRVGEGSALVYVSY